jgi:hypothetical protein
VQIKPAAKALQASNRRGFVKNPGCGGVAVGHGRGKGRCPFFAAQIQPRDIFEQK